MYNPFISIILCCMTTFGFVVSLYVPGFLARYIHVHISNISIFHRDHHNVIFYRILGSILFTFVFWPLILLFFSHYSEISTYQEFVLIHYDLLWKYSSITNHINWILLSLQVYTSEIIVLLYEISRLFISHKKIIDLEFQSISRIIRDYFVSPILEEIIFRGIQTKILVFGGLSHYWSSIFFGLAHVHHLIEDIVINQDLDMNMIIKTLVQFSYTCLFGLYCSFILYITDGQLIICILIHMICNFFGFPNPFLSKQLGFLLWPGKLGFIKQIVFI